MPLADQSRPDLPLRPLLRPGVHVCRRSATELQVGLDGALAVAVPDRPEVRDTLAALGQGALPEDADPAAGRLVARLCERDLLVDGDAWLAAVGDADSGEAAGTLTAAVADHGCAAGAVLRRRRSIRVLVDDLGLPRAAARLRELLAQSGLGGSNPDHGDDLVVLVSGQEPDRELVDHWMREDVPHVLLTASEGILRVGPFVDPGRTACLRCLDAAATERDPRHGLVLQQYADASPAPGALPSPLPGDLLDLAVGHLARDVTRWADGLRPRTWSATVRLDAELDLAPQPLPRHPGCGCAWAAAVAG